VAGCARAANLPIDASPNELARLEARVAESPDDLAAGMMLGMAYWSAGRTDDARLHLEKIVQRDPDYPAGLVALGLTYEDLRLFEEARALYVRYLENATSADLITGVRGRLARLDRLDVQAYIRDGIGAEAASAGGVSDPQRVAVLPFVYAGADPNGPALSRALGELLTYDLAEAAEISIVQSTRIQVLFDELQLSGDLLLEQSSAGYVGAVVDAGRVVQGLLSGSGDALRLDVLIVDAQRSAVIDSVVSYDSPERLAFLQKGAVESTLAALGVNSTSTEPALLRAQSGDDLEAMVQFGLGLLAGDRGDHATAALHFRRASEREIGVGLAAQRADEARLLATGLGVSSASLLGLAFTEAGALPPGVLDLQRLVPSALSGRDPISEVLGTELLGNGSGVEVIIRRPQE
jgi:tetratricopeptide (TPR) repeat protein